VRVDPGVLGGASVPAPAELAEAVGIGAHQRQTFAGHFGPVTLANDPPGPVLVSLRPIALAAAASAGDTLTLGFGAQGELTVRLASDEPIAGEGVTLLSQPAEEVV